MIHHLYLVVENEDDTTLMTEPPERLVKLEVIGGVASMTVHDVDMATNTPGPATADFAVSAASLVRALQALMEDEAAGPPPAWVPRRPQEPSFPVRD